jgi:NTE family protein
MADPLPVKTVGLALQGGGAHAAFTWGVLDRLLDEVARGTLRIAAISGASGGALNGAACAYGLCTSPAQARRALAQLWEAVADQSAWNPFLFNSPTAELASARRWNVDNNLFVIGQGMLQQISSPYLTPWVEDPIGSIMDQVIPDFGPLNAPQSERTGPDLFVSATNVTRTSLRIFGPGEIDAKALMASTCFPTLFPAVEIEGEFYWDGGYLANPALNPLVDAADDLLNVLIDPLRIAHRPPKLPRQIVNRINEVSFSASWVLEARQIELVNEMIRSGIIPAQGPDGKTYREKRFHVISADPFMEEIGAASKDTPSREFFHALRAEGHRCADAWVTAHLDDVGVKPSYPAEQLKARLKGTATSAASL